MNQPLQPGAAALVAAFAQFYAFRPPKLIRLLLYGLPAAVRMEIKTLHHICYAEPNEWNQRMPTSQPGEMMGILRRRFSNAAAALPGLSLWQRIMYFVTFAECTKWN